MKTPLSSGLQAPWCWCGLCQRAYISGTGREIQFTATALHAHPALLKVCPYVECGGSTARYEWQWATLRQQHPEYPVTPERDVIYLR